MKDKKLKNEQDKKETVFYYEAIGFIVVILSIIVVAQLGRVGVLLTMLFKVAFGDWYLLAVLAIFIYGGYSILNHRSFNFKNQRFVGYIFCLLGLLMITHFPVHKYVLSTTQSYFKSTWSHYMGFIKSGTDTYLGGGIIGGILFYLVYYLLGSIGVGLVAFLSILFGFTMIVNKSIIEIWRIVIKRIKNVGKYQKSFSNFFKYDIGKKNKNEIISIYDKNKDLHLKIFDDYRNSNIMEFQEKYANELKGLIVSIFNNLSLQHREQQLSVSYSATCFTYSIYSEYECNIVGEKLTAVLDERVYIHRIDKSLNIEVNNKHICILTIKSMLLMQSVLKNNYLLPIGINLKNQLEEIDISKDGNMLLIGEYKSGIRTFVTSYIMSMLVKMGTETIVFNLYDELSDFSQYAILFKEIEKTEIKEYLNRIIREIDDRIQLLSENKCRQIDEYNIKQDMDKKVKMRRIVYVIQIDEYNKTNDFRYIDDKIMYIIQLGKDVGIYTLYISREPQKVSTVLFSLFKHKMIFSLKNKKIALLESSQFNVLEQPGEAIYIKETSKKRIQTALVTIEEVNKIIK